MNWRSWRVRGWVVVGLYAACLALALARSDRKSSRPSTRPAAAKPGSAPAFASDGAIAVVDLRGPIALGMGGGLRDGTADGVLRRLRELREQSEVKAVVLRINTPGGTVASVQEIHGAVLALKGDGKKVVASLGDIAASGGFYVAAAADRIVANPGSLVGSIGVVFHLMNFEELTKKIGVQATVIKSGAMKDMGSPYRPLSAEERRVFEGLVASAYGQFLEAVARGRKMPLDQLRPLADGRVFTGEQARAAGLVDALGSYDDALKEAAALAGIKSAHPKIIGPVRSWDRWLEAFGGLFEGPLGEWRRLLGVRGSLLYVWE